MVVPQVCQPPAATLVHCWSPSTRSGVLREEVVPLPSSPREFWPQHHMLPSDWVAQAWPHEAETSRHVVPVPTWRGTLEFALSVPPS